MSGVSDASSDSSNGGSIDRRSFLTGAGALATGATFGWLPGCGGASSPDSTSVPGSAPPSTDPVMITQTAAGDLGLARSLVCVMLHGGADSFNMFVPRDHQGDGNDHATFARTRGALTADIGSLHGFGDGAFGLHPGMAGLAGLAERNQLAVVTNVGPLGRPITRAEVLAESAPVPESLFAHDAQQKLWQTARSTLTTDQGWGGSVLASVGASATVSPGFSIAGSNPWLSSPAAPYSQLSATTPIELMRGYDASLRSWIPSSVGLADVMAESVRLAGASPNPMEQAAAERLGTSKVMTEQLMDATAATPANEVGMEGIDGNRLALQLRQVARLILNRESLGMSRQVFFVHMGGWDTHSGQAERLPVLIAELDAALTSFQGSLDAMGVAETVTTFTSSDFGRTLTSNGDGTDHGWGGHAFVLGGAVAGGQYGTMPSFVSGNNPDDAGDVYGNFAGRIIPTTSVAQYGATLDHWMGLDEAQLAAAFPDLGNFEHSNLGFMT